MAESKQPTVSDVFYLLVFVFAILFVTNFFDSCHSSWRYRDLRDRLERLEKR